MMGGPNSNCSGTGTLNVGHQQSAGRAGEASASSSTLNSNCSSVEQTTASVGDKMAAQAVVAPAPAQDGTKFALIHCNKSLKSRDTTCKIILKANSVEVKNLWVRTHRELLADISNNFRPFGQEATSTPRAIDSSRCSSQSASSQQVAVSNGAQQLQQARKPLQVQQRHNNATCISDGTRQQQHELTASAD